MSEEMKISRREFLKFVAAYTKIAIAEQFFPETTLPESKDNRTPTSKENKEPTEAAKERKEHFKPFTEGEVWWQYIAFQYTDQNNKKKGVVVSFTELNENNDKTHTLLVMNHDLETGTTEHNQYQGVLTFNEETLTYTFQVEGENPQIQAKLAFDMQKDRYTLQVHTNEFNSDEIDPKGIILLPLGNLVKASKDGKFTVARQNNIEIETEYYADHVSVATASNPAEIIGYGRRDSENLIKKINWGVSNNVENTQNNLDIDHTWIHVIVELEDGTIACITGWQCTTGGDFKFADIRIINKKTEQVTTDTAYNEEDKDFQITFSGEQQEMEQVANRQMPHGGTVTATNEKKTLFELKIDGNPGQAITGKGKFTMIEAHAKVQKGLVLGRTITQSLSCLYESTKEFYMHFLPNIKA